MRRNTVLTMFVLSATCVACTGDDGNATESGLSTVTTPTGATTAGPATTTTTPNPTTAGTATQGTTTSTASTTSGTTGTPKFDVGDSETGGTGPTICDGDGEDGVVVPCSDEGPADAFTPTIEWSWAGEGDETYALSNPVIINLTDDNEDGSIDLCDTPDIAVLAVNKNFIMDINNATGHIYVLDGATGDVLGTSEQAFGWLSDVSGADIDLDGEPELLAIAPGMVGPLLALNADLTPVETWSSDVMDAELVWAPAIADLDADGAPEIVVGSLILDNTGALIEKLPDTPPASLHATAIADLDQDGVPEIVMGRSAYTFDPNGSTEYYMTALDPGIPQIADLTDDGTPEILLTNQLGISVLDFEGNILVQEATPLPVPTNSPLNWTRPAAVHDFDGDGLADFAMSARERYAVMHLEFNDPNWEVVVLDEWPVLDASGSASGTAFDFLGDGVAEAIYGDENNLFVFELGNPTPLLEIERSSRTGIEYPLVADVDNDGSAEIVVVSNENLMSMMTSPTVQVIGEAEGRWIQARRVWNQHTYHVSNVSEKGAVPQVEMASWKGLNTYRTNSQIENGAVCQPPG